jgi:pimeloyl-ACP methyl ester carboxylesterase
MDWTSTRGPIVDPKTTEAAVPVVLLHCSTASGRQWARLGETLGRRFPIAAPDQWSCGKRGPWPGHEPFTLASEAIAVHEIIDRLGTPVHLVGHSYGGALALHVARHRPETLASLSMIEPSAFHLLRRSGANDAALFQEIAGVAAGINQALVSGDYWGGMARFTDYWNGTGTWDRMSDEMRAKLAPRLAKVALDFRALFDEETALADFARLDIPTVIIRGSLSPAPSCRIVEMLARAFADAHVEVISDAGHLSPFTHPDPVNRIIAAHLKGERRTSKQAA